MTATSLGLAAMVPNPISLAATLVLVASAQFQVRAVEEPHLIPNPRLRLHPPTPLESDAFSPASAVTCAASGEVPDVNDEAGSEPAVPAAGR